MALGKSHDGLDRQIAVLAYGSLLAHPGEWLGSRMQRLIRWETPFGVEYLGVSKRRGGAPTLVQSSSHRPVNGGLIILATTENTPNNEGISIDKVCRVLAHREEGADGTGKIKSDLNLLGFRIIYSDFDAETKKPLANDLATAAIESVGHCVGLGHPFMNGIRYLSENLEWGVVTEVSHAYRDAILSQTETKSLDQAEHKVLEDAITTRSTWSGQPL
jgi:hypothetical protein